MGFPIPSAGNVTEDEGVVGGFLTTTGDSNFLFADDTGAWTAETITGIYGSQLVIDGNGVWTYTADNSNPDIQALNAGESLTETFTVSSNAGSTSVTIEIFGADEPPCFVEGTLIDTPQGPRPVEDIRAGDFVLTRDEGPQPVMWSGRREIDLHASVEWAEFRPIRICKDALAPGVPDRDILVSPMHRLLLCNPNVTLMTGEDEVFCAARHLVNARTIRVETPPSVAYHHLLFDRHHVVCASGCYSESLYPGEVALNGFEDETRSEVLSLFPELRSLPGSYGQSARLVLKRYEALLVHDVLRPQTCLVDALQERCA